MSNQQQAMLKQAQGLPPWALYAAYQITDQAIAQSLFTLTDGTASHLIIAIGQALVKASTPAGVAAWQAALIAERAGGAK